MSTLKTLSLQNIPENIFPEAPSPVNLAFRETLYGKLSDSFSLKAMPSKALRIKVMHCFLTAISFPRHVSGIIF